MVDINRFNYITNINNNTTEYLDPLNAKLTLLFCFDISPSWIYRHYDILSNLYFAIGKEFRQSTHLILVVMLYSMEHGSIGVQLVTSDKYSHMSSYGFIVSFTCLIYVKNMYFWNMTCWTRTLYMLPLTLQVTLNRLLSFLDLLQLRSTTTIATQ